MKIKILICLFNLVFLISCKKENNILQVDNDSFLIEKEIIIEQNVCEDLVHEIISSSKEFKEQYEFLQKNNIKKGITFGYMIYSSPNPQNDNQIEKSVYYEYAYHLNHPDKIQVVSRYRFHSKNHTLGKYDAVDNDFHLINYDVSLLKNYKINCNK